MPGFLRHRSNEKICIYEKLQCTVLRELVLINMCSVLDCNSPNEWPFTTIPWIDSSEAENRQKYKTITQKSPLLLSSLPVCMCIKNDVANKVLI